jgi:hypothetical protein
MRLKSKLTMWEQNHDELARVRSFFLSARCAKSKLRRGTQRSAGGQRMTWFGNKSRPTSITAP